MSENKVNKAVVCPMCGDLGKAEIYTSVNVAKHKSCRERVLDGSLFAWTCPSCGYNARLTYPILYNDMKNRFMVYLIPKIDRFQLCDKELEEKYSNLRNINKRVVSDFNSFKEKIFIFESRLDDMAVELTKVAISQTVSKKLGGVEVSEGYLSMYDRESNTMGFTYFTGEERTHLRQVQGHHRKLRRQGQKAKGLYQDRPRVGGEHPLPLQARQADREAEQAERVTYQRPAQA